MTSAELCYMAELDGVTVHHKCLLNVSIYLTTDDYGKPGKLADSKISEAFKGWTCST